MNEKDLYILWTSPDEITAHYMVLMYATNSMLSGWWDNVTVIIWGASAKLVAENENVQERVNIARQAGVEITACETCASQLGVLSDLEGMGIEMQKWGEPLTEVLKAKGHLLTV